MSLPETTSTESFSPSLLIDGETVTPRGWMWVLGFALGGCGWAIKEASTPEFLQAVKDDLIRDQVEKSHKQIAFYEEKIKKLKEELL